MTYGSVSHSVVEKKLSKDKQLTPYRGKRVKNYGYDTL